MSDSFSVTVIGGLVVRRGGRPIGPGPEAHKPVALMTLLALRSNQVVSKDELIAELWTTPPMSSRNLVEKYISSWRRELPPSRLRTIGQGYRLELAADECDLLACERDAATARTAIARGELETGAAALSSAVQRWPAGVDGVLRAPMPERDRRRLVEFYLSTLEDYAAAALTTVGGDSTLLVRLDAAQLHDPMREQLCALRMWGLSQQGRQGEALACYEQLRDTLDQELGQQPGPALRAMHVRVLQQDPTLLRAPASMLQSAPTDGPAPPQLSNLPHRHRHFVGREDELLQMSRLLEETDSQHPAAIAVWGLVGTGKSALLLEYAHRHSGGHSCLWWVDAGTPGSVAAGLEALSDRLGVAMPTERELGLEALWAALDRRGRWLLILDNASSPAEVATYWPRGDGTVLVSSLNPDWRRIAEVMPLDLLRPEPASVMLTGGGPGDASTAALARALGYLPLALGQAAAYMDQTGMTCADYLPLFLRRRRQLLERGIPDDHVGTIETTWRLASAELSATDPASVQLLSLASLLSAERIPLSLLRSGAELLPMELRGAVDSEVGLEDAIRHARRYSLLVRNGDVLTMHFLVQEVIFTSMPAAEREQWCRRLTALLAHAAPLAVTARSDWPQWESLAPHVLALAIHCLRAAIFDADFLAVLRRTATYFLTRASFADGLTAVRVAHSLLAGADGVDPALIGEVLTELGTLLEQSGNYRDALSAQEQAVVILQEHRAPGDPWLARALSGLAGVLTCHLGVSLWKPAELEDTERRLRHALEILRVALGSTDPMVARTLAALGQIVQDQGNLVLGRQYFDGAVAVLENSYGTDHPETARTYSKLAFVLGLLGEYDRSAELQQLAYDKLRSVYGDQDPEVAWPLSNLALIQLATGRLESALSTAQRARAIFAAADADSAAVHITSWREARIYLAMGRPADAVRVLAPALAALRQVLDADLRDISEMTADLASAQRAAASAAG